MIKKLLFVVSLFLVPHFLKVNSQKNHIKLAILGFILVMGLGNAYGQCPKPGTPSPGTPSGPASPCEGSTVTYSVTNSSGATSYSWFYPSDWQVVSGSTNKDITFLVGKNSGNVGVYGVNSCGNSDNSSQRNIQVTLKPSAPSQPTSYNPSCNGFTAQWGTNGTTVDYLVDVSTDSNFGNFIDGYKDLNVGNVQFIVLTGLVSSTTYYYRIRRSSACGISDYSTSNSATTTSGSAGGTVSGGTTICSGNTSGQLTLAGHSGTIQKWQSSVSPFTTWSDISNTLSTYTSVALSNTTRFRAVVKNGSCSSYSASTTVTVNPSVTASVSIVASPTGSICSGTSTTFTVTPTNGGTNPAYQWKLNGSNRGTNSPTFTSTTLANNDVVSVVMTSNISSCLTGNPATSNGITMVVNTAPAITTQPTTPATTCSGSGTQSMTVVASGTGLTYQWRKDNSNLTNGTIVGGATTATLTLTNPTTTDAGSYDVVITGTCSPAVTSTARTISVNALPTITNTPQAKTCANRHVAYNTQTGKSNYIWSVSGILNTDYKIIDRGTTTDSYIVLEWLTTGSRTVSVNYTNPSGCSAPAPATYTTEIVILDKGQVNGGKHICTGETLPTLTFNTYANSNVRYTDTSVIWQYSDTNNTNYIDIPGTAGQTSYTPTSISGTSRQYRVVVDNGTCSDQSIYSAIDIDVTTAITAQSTAGQSVCSGTAFTPISVTAVGTPRGGQSSVEYQWYRNTTNSNTGGTSLGAANNATTNTYTPQAGTAGISYYYYCIVTGNCSTATSAVSGAFITNATPTAPTIVSKLLPTCTTPTGSITLSGLPATGILRSLLGNSTTATYTITGTTTTISGLVPGKYKFAVDNSCGTTVYSSETNLSGNTWNGATWSGGNAGPGSNDILIFEGDYTATTDLTACSCTINNNAKVTINTGKTLTLSDFVHVDSGSLIFENNASLLQTNPNAINSGSIDYKRSTPDPGIRQADYVYWSSPVKDQTLVGVSQDLTLSDKYYMYGGTGVSWIGVPKTTVMVIGKGYIIRGPQNWSNTDRQIYTATFKGVPNNGSFTTNEHFLAGKNYLIGNPYPSALSADKLITDNNVLEGTLYFWTHNTPVVLVGAYKYKADDYATYNLTGGAIAAKTGNSGNNNNPPSGYIGAGQSFMAAFKAPGEITYTNDMRFGGSDNSQFFKPGKTSKTTGLEKNRIWLNITNTEGLFKQMLVGYIEGATNNYEGWYDGLSVNGNKYVDFYSINSINKLTIQGRALPFTDADTVPVGYVSSIAGDFTISIDHADGLLDSQAIYLEDKTTGKIHDLRAADYTFTSEIGTFDDRFVLRYTNKTLGTGDFENIENGLIVSVKDKTIKVISAKEVITEVIIFDINGKQIYNKKKIGSTELQISNLQSGNQVLLAKVILENGYVVTKKIIFN
jgi:hypothetical protein